MLQLGTRGSLPVTLGSHGGGTVLCSSPPRQPHNFGILPVVIKDEDYEQIEQGDILEIMGLHKTVAESDELVVRVKHKALEFGRLVGVVQW